MSAPSDPIREVWQGGAADLFAMSQVTHAFGALSLAFSDGGAAPTVWFPDYFCDGALTLLRQSGAAIAFYPVDAGYGPDWAACRAMAEGGPPDIFVLVHYMGARGDLETARAFCDDTGAKLLEDATQILRPAGGVGSFGDFVCFGPRKFFDLPDGGLLVVRHAEDARRVAEALRALPQRSPPALRWRVAKARKALKRRLGLEPKPAGTPARRRLEDVHPEPRPFAEPFMSAAARKELSRAIRAGRLDEIVRRQLRAEHAVAGFAEQRNDVTLFERPPDVVACWTGLKCSDPVQAQAALDALRAQGLVAHPWPNRLPPETLDRAPHATATALRNTTLIVLPARTPQG